MIITMMMMTMVMIIKIMMIITMIMMTMVMIIKMMMMMMISAINEGGDTDDDADDN